MESLSINERMFTYIGLCRTPSNTHWMNKALYCILGVMIFVILFCAKLSCLVFIMKTDSSIEDKLYAVFPGIASLAGLYTIGSTALLRNDLYEIFIKFQSINNIIHLPASKNNVQFAVKLARIITLFFIKYVVCGYFFMALMLFIWNIVYCSVFDGYMNPDHLFVPYKFSAPWNQRQFNPGYIASTVYTMAAGGSFVYVNSTLLTFFIGATLHFQAFSRHFREIIKRSNAMFQSKCNVFYISKVKESLSEAANFHMEVKRLFEQVAHVFNECLGIQFYCSTIHISTSAFQLDLMMKHFNPLVVIVVLIGLSVTVSSLFLYSYFGTYTTEIFLKYSDYLFESPWNDLPIKLQKHVLIMISNSQRSHCYRGNGLFILDLKFFTKVMNSAFSAYIMLTAVSSR